MMRRIRISDAAMTLIRAASEHEFRQTARRVGDQWEVPLSEEVFARVRDAQLPGETIDDTLVRVVSAYSQPRPH
jgi:hypothetical protein